MLHSKSLIEKISPFFENLKKDHTIKSYSILLELNMQISIFIEVETEYGEDYFFDRIPELKTIKNLVRLEERLFEGDFLDGLEDIELKETLINNLNNQSSFRLRRRFELIQEEHTELLNKWIAPCPIVTFYSYKGGVGRSTSLAVYASYLAIKHDKKVIILDCDFEAPGFTNYYDLNLGEGGEKEKEGIVEYLLDSMTNRYISDEPLWQSITGTVSKYSYQVKSVFAQKEGGKGEIHIIPAGNLSDMDDYLEALSRIDLSSTQSIVNQLKSFFDDLKLAFKLDENSVILIDSRTGFNDTFGVLSLFSPIIVGFFGTNIQNQYGINFFLEKFSTINSQKSVVITQAYNAPFKGRLSGQILAYKELNAVKFEAEHGFEETYEMPKIDVFAILGENEEKSSSLFIHFVSKVIDSGVFPELDKLFMSITERIGQEKKKYIKKTNYTLIEPIENVANEPTNEKISFNPTFVIDSWKDSKFLDIELLQLRDSIISSLNKNYPQWYAEHEKDINKISPKTIYYRNKLKDFFNPRYLAIVGSKGTGKTFLYLSFKNKGIVRELCALFEKNETDYIFINIIGLHNSIPTKDYIEINKFSSSYALSKEFHFRRFWYIYICNQILKNEIIKEYIKKYEIDIGDFVVFEINNNEETAQHFYQFIESDNKFLQIEKILQLVDNAVNKEKKTLYILFDQLEFLVPITDWQRVVTPLFKSWISSPFKSIVAKFFMRSDLYEYNLGGFANKNSVKSIGIEWDKNEIFAYFFKHLLQISEEVKSAFYKLLYRYWVHYWGHEQTKTFILELEKEHSEAQIPAEEEILTPLVEAFFGKYANYYDSSDPKFGQTSYDWFEKNLKDANKQVSLRPFWGLIEAAIRLYEKQESIDVDRKLFNLYGAVKYNDKNRMVEMKKGVYPLLPALYYTNRNVRQIAVYRYYDDLQKDAGNEMLFDFYRFMTDSTSLPVRRQYSYKLSEFEKLIDAFEVAYPKALGQKTEDSFFHVVTNFLARNGIVERLDFKNGRYTNYRFPYLYRGFFQLQANHFE